MKVRCFWMPKIRSSADLRNNYNEISTFCHDYAEPVFITKNGKGDLAVMSIETYEALTARFDLYAKLQEGLDDVAAGRTRPLGRCPCKELSKQMGASNELQDSCLLTPARARPCTLPSNYIAHQLKNPLAAHRHAG